MPQSFSGGLIQIVAMIFAVCPTALARRLALFPILGAYVYSLHNYAARPHVLSSGAFQ
jgi:hypothetical protein